MPPATAAATVMELFPPPTERADLAPGVVSISGWLSPTEQRALVNQFRVWALPPAGLRHPRVPSGHLMSVQSVCLGWHWQPYAYSRTADDTDGAAVKPLPSDIARLARQAVADTFGAATPALRAGRRRSRTCTRRARGSASIRTARSHRTRPSSPSAWATRVCSASRASIAGPRRSSTSRCVRAIFWCSVARIGVCTTECRRSSTTRDRESSGCRPEGSASRCARPASLAA